MNILFATPEAAPYYRTGGLSDVARALPDALAARGHTVHIVHPFYRSVERLDLPMESAEDLVVPWPGGPLRVQVALHRSERGAPALLVQQPLFFSSDRPYEPDPGDPVAHIRRFAFFSKAVLALADAYGADVIHLNDWPTGLVAAYSLGSVTAPATVFAIHNLGYQGNFSPIALAELDIPAHLFRTENGLEFHGQASCLKAGIALSDRLVTVSPTYAREIQTPEYGAGFDGLLRYRRRLLHGILNGLDPATWDPATDPCIAHRYSAEALQAKRRNGEALRAELGLKPGGALVVLVSRLAHQKGIDIVLEALPALLRRDVRIAVLGDGDPVYHNALAARARRRSGRLAVSFRFDDALARRFYAGADFFLMPSRYEPCGLGQLIAQRYGTIPIVRSTGGLADTVQDGVTGFSFAEPTAGALLAAVDRALAVRGTAEEVEMRRRCMLLDRSWDRSAAEYERVYTMAIGA